MTFPNEQAGFLDWLQSGDGDSIDYLKQVIQGHTDASEDAALSNNAIHQELVASDDHSQVVAEASPNYAAYLEDTCDDHSQVVTEAYPNYAAYLEDTYDEDLIYDQLLNELTSTIYPGPGFVEGWRLLVGLASTDDAVMQTNNDQQPECIQLDETQEKTTTTSDNEDDNDDSYMCGDRHDGKSFLSWLLYGSDDDMEVFKKDVSNENPTEDTPRSTTCTRAKDASILKPITNLRDKNSNKESIITPKSRSQASTGMLSRREPTGNTAKNRAVLRSNTKALGTYGSYIRPRRHRLLFDYDTVANAGSSSTQSARVSKSTPSNSTRCTPIEGDSVAREVSSVKESKRSKDPLRRDSNASNDQDGDQQNSF